MQDLPVVVIGAGPGGLAVAVALAQEDIPVIVIERESELTHDLRAGTYHPPTIEMLDQLGVGELMREAGIEVRIWQIRDRQQGVIAEFDLSLLAKDTSYPFRLHCEQHKLATFLLQRLRGFSCASVYFNAEFISSKEQDDCISVNIDTVEGSKTFDACYLIGADGGRSQVRKHLDIEFEGFTWPERFLVASTEYDLDQHGFARNAYIADPVEWCATFKMPHLGPPGLWRMAFPIAEEVSDEKALSIDFVKHKLKSIVAELAQHDVPYHSIYRVHQRVAKTFRVGRTLLIGDAAHINNPLGGMGLNSAIHDAINLADKLTAIWRDDTADIDALLEHFVRQRRQVNIEFVQQMSIRNKQLLEERDPTVRQQHLDALRETAANDERAHQHLLRTSMIASLRRAAEIE